MPLLQPPAPVTEPTPLERQVEQLLSAPRQIALQIIQIWEQKFDLMWSNRGPVTVAQRLAAIGPAGAELLERNTELVTFLLTQLSGEDQALIDRINAKLATIPAYTVAQNGTVTLD